MKKREIKSREEIELLINQFYNKVFSDSEIGYFFQEFLANSWEEHRETMIRFWSTILLDEISYKGNPIVKHIQLSEKSPLSPSHFKKWLSLWQETIEELFEGEIANNAIIRANSIASLMEFKILNSNKTNTI